MKTLELQKDLFWCGVQDPQLRTFDIIMETEFGTTYNSYVVRGSEASCVVETAKEKFRDDYLDAVAAVTPIAQVQYLIVNHTEPDHAGSVAALIERNPGLKVVGTATALTFLKSIVHREFYQMPVKDGDTLSLGDKTLRFLVLPNLHWPDTMYTYVEETGTLFTCDSFGSHYSHEGILRSNVPNENDYWKATRYYFENILGPFRRPYMVNALKKIAPLELRMICPGHGPVLDTGIPELMEKYAAWCQEGLPFPRKTVVIPYVSAYGYTAALAEKIAQGVRDSGEVDVKLYDLNKSDVAAVLGDIGRAEGLLLGTPTILAEALKPIWDLTTCLYAPIHKGKLASAFGSYGWSGEGVPHMVERLRQLKMNVPDEGFRVRLKPGETDLVGAYEYGYNFGCLLQKKENDRTKKPAGHRKLVKCLVCGEIFDASLKVCPVCGVGPENFVPVEEDEISARRDTDEKFLILGGGAAAYNAAKAIRERNATASVILISEEDELPYNRPMLTKSMMADFTAAQLAIAPEAWYEEHHVTVLNGRRVSEIDVQSKQVRCEDGLTLVYDKLIYALGARCFVPPIPGSEQEHVVSIRCLKDARKVLARVGQAKHAVVVGGGVLGLEAAWELRRSGLDVTVLEAAPQIMGRQLDKAAAELIAARMAEKGIALHEGVKIEKITADAVVLSDGRSFPAELVIVSAGVRANTALAEKAGIRVERAVVVDDHMRTSVSDVYACGDCAIYNGVSYALWAEAVEMGKAAGANASGDDVSYTTVNGALTFNGLETHLFALGDCGKDPKRAYRTVEMRDDQRHTYEKYYFVNGRLTGVILLGDTSKMAAVTQAIADGAGVESVIK